MWALSHTVHYLSSKVVVAYRPVQTRRICFTILNLKRYFRTMAECVSEEENRILVQCTCKCKKKDCTVTLTSSKLSIGYGEKQTGKEYVRITDVLSVYKYPSTDDQTQGPLYINYAKQEKNLELKKCSLMLESKNPSDLKQIGDTIQVLLGNIEQRPKKLLVLVNPKSGRSRGIQVYEQTVAPIFKESNVETDVIITERLDHTKETLSTYDLQSVSGIVVVGGDGIYHSVGNCLMQRRMKELDRNVDDPNADIPDIAVPIGIIPCGTGNGKAYSCYGSFDVVTAALSIVLGYKAKSNIVAVHCNGKLIAYSTLFTGYGFWGDIAHITESKRSQGVLRYAFATANHLFIKGFRQMNLTIHWKSKIPENSEPLDEQVTEGNAIGLLGMVGMTSKDSMYSNQPPLDKFVGTYLSKPTGRMKFLSFMYDLARINLDKIKRRDDIIAMEGCEWTVKLDKPSDPETELGRLERMMNIDGECFTLPVPEYYIRLCSGKITLYNNLPYSTGRELKRN